MASTPDDPFDLARFVAAQATSYAGALAELRDGHKRGHWSWYVLPQLRGLGRSPAAQTYGISGLAEARAYLAHPLLGPRLRECVQALLTHRALAVDDILGPTDAMKFRSCLTLFHAAAPGDPLFADALARFFGGEPDRLTLQGLG